MAKHRPPDTTTSPVQRSKARQIYHGSLTWVFMAKLRQLAEQRSGWTGEAPIPTRAAPFPACPFHNSS